MARFLIEVPHEANKAACLRAARIFVDTGSHFLSHADWGCMDGVHKAWLIMELDNKEQARNVLPPAYRRQAQITQLNAFTMERIEEIGRRHRG